MTPFDYKLDKRLADYRHIVERLLFAPISQDSKIPSTLYHTSHLFLLGDLNFRLDIPKENPLYQKRFSDDFSQAIQTEEVREELKEFDQLTIEKRKGTVFAGLHEGEFWKFKCTYKYKIGEVDKYRYENTLHPLQLHACSSIKSVAQNERLHGRTAFYTRHTQILLNSQVSLIFCIPASLHTLHLIM